jgi:hypothetical protein
MDPLNTVGPLGLLPFIVAFVILEIWRSARDRGPPS